MRFLARARLAISRTRQVRRTTVMDHIFAFSHVQTRYLALGPRFGRVLVPQVKGFASRRSFWADFCDSWRGRGWRYQELDKYDELLQWTIYSPSPMCQQGIWRLDRGSDRYLLLKQKVLVPGGRSGQIFEVLGEGEAGDIKNSTSTLNYCNGPYIRLLPCANKVFSAWTEVRTGTCLSLIHISEPTRP